MPTLDEVITSDSVKRLHEAYVKGVEYLRRQGEEGDYNWFPGINAENMEVAGEPILRYVHAALLRTARLSPNPPNPRYPYKASLSISDVVRAEVGKWPGGGEKARAYAQSVKEGGPARVSPNMVSSITRLLRGNGLIWKMKARDQLVWVRDPGGVPAFAYTPNRRERPDPKLEKRIEEEAIKTVSTLRTRRDLRSIRLPEAKPEAVMDWAKRFVPAALDVQAALEKAEQRIAELEEELAAKTESGQWEGVTSELEEMFRDTGRGGVGDSDETETG